MIDPEDFVDFAKSRFSYDPSTGVLFWIDPGQAAFPTAKGYRIFLAKFCGKPAGSISKKDGYVRVFARGVSILCHRLGWAIAHNEWVDGDIDHKDTVRSNNRLTNLRPATRSQNRMNTPICAKNASGAKGVHWHKATGKWCASISAHGKRVHLGVFEKKEDAVTARLQAANEMHGEFAR